MKNALLLLFAPFVLAGGLLTGYMAHGIQLGTYEYTNPYFMGGIALIIVGWLIRRTVFKKIVKENNKRGTDLTIINEEFEELERTVQDQQQVLNAIRVGVLQNVDLKDNTLVLKTDS